MYNGDSVSKGLGIWADLYTFYTFLHDYCILDPSSIFFTLDFLGFLTYPVPRCFPIFQNLVKI